MLQTLTPDHFAAILDFAAATTTQNEPMCRALRVTPEDFKVVFSEIVRLCCESNLSSGIFDDDHTPLACSLALPYDTYKSLSFPDVDAFAPIFKVLNTLDSEPIEHAVYHFLICTAPEAANKGYAKQVIRHTLYMAYTHGTRDMFTYDCVIADATNVVSQHILRGHFKYAMLNFIPYKQIDAFETITCTYAAMRLMCLLEDVE